MSRRFFDSLSRPRVLVTAVMFILLIGLAAVMPEQLFAQDSTQEIAENALSDDAMRGKKVFRKCKAFQSLDMML